MVRVIMTMVIVLLISGCNTVAGVGKDIQHGGEAIERAAK